MMFSEIDDDAERRMRIESNGSEMVAGARTNSLSHHFTYFLSTSL